jgi:hypothetical protein
VPRPADQHSVGDLAPSTLAVRTASAGGLAAAVPLPGSWLSATSGPLGSVDPRDACARSPRIRTGWSGRQEGLGRADAAQRAICSGRAPALAPG